MSGTHLPRICGRRTFLSSTIEKYLRDAAEFSRWLGGQALNKEAAAGWREHLLEEGYAPATINSMLSAVNRLLKFLGREDCRIRFLRAQRKTFREQNRELTRAEYQRLLDTAAEHGQERLGLLMETICATGIRVSEVQYITVEVRAERAGGDQPERQNPHHPPPVQALPEAIEIRPETENRLRRDFSRQKRKAGLPPSNLAGDESAVQKAEVEASKVFPHTLRHLFATLFYKVCRDIAKLADVLGHSSINTITGTCTQVTESGRVDNTFTCSFDDNAGLNY